MTERNIANLSWFDFRAIGRWIGILYGRPRHLLAALAEIPDQEKFRFGTILTLHSLIYILIPIMLIRWLLQINFHLNEQEAFEFVIVKYFATLLIGLFIGIAAGAVIGGLLGRNAIGESGVVAGRIAGGIAFGLGLAFFFGIMFGLPKDPVFGVIYGITLGSTSGIIITIFTGLAFSTVEEFESKGIGGLSFGARGIIVASILGGFLLGIIQSIIIGLDLGLSYGVITGSTLTISFIFSSLRCYYYPWHIILFFIAPNTDGFRFHPIVWDGLCALPFIGLDRFLIAYQTDFPIIGEKYIARLIAHYASQRQQALRAFTAIRIREAASLEDLGRLDEIVNRLPEGDKGFLMQTPRIREMASEIADVQRRMDTVDRPFLRQPYAEALVSRIEAFRGQVSGFREPLATEFRNAADVWLIRAETQLEQVQKITIATDKPPALPGDT